MELKDCPFCGGKVDYQWLEAGTVDVNQLDEIEIICMGCNAAMFISGKEPDEAIKEWNKRSKP